MRLGYLCLRCLEPQEQALPDQCGLCGYSMREFQPRDLANEFEGVKQIGPSTSVDDEVGRLREARLREQYVPGSSAFVERIWTPPDAA